MNLEGARHILFDIGEGFAKAGYREESPRAVVPSVIGIPKTSNDKEGTKRDFYCGDQAEQKRSELILNKIIENGTVRDWNDWENFMEYLMTDELRCESCESFHVLAEAPLNPEESRKKMAKIILETFGTHGLYIGKSTFFSMLSTGKVSGLICESGYSLTNIASFYDGHPIRNSIKSVALGGKDLTLNLQRLRGKISEGVNKDLEFYLANDIKENTCYVALNFEKEEVIDMKYELPNLEEIIIKRDRIIPPEGIFQPSILGKKDQKGIGQLILDSVEATKYDIRKELYANIGLSGGNTMFPGLPERLEKEVKHLAGESMGKYVKVVAPPERRYGTWIGESVFAGASCFESWFITKDEYDEVGEDIIHKKLH